MAEMFKLFLAERATIALHEGDNETHNLCSDLELLLIEFEEWKRS